MRATGHGRHYGETRLASDGASVNVTGCVTYLQPDECYIESTDRSSGIWVQSADTTGVAVGDLVAAAGVVTITNGEKCIASAVLSRVGAGTAIKPLAMRNNWLGGRNSAGDASLQDYVAYKIPGDGTGREWRTTGGASNIGLLVKTTGIVNGVYHSPINDAHWFYVDDGSGVVSDCGDKGIIVYSDADLRDGNLITVTGISSIEASYDDPTRLVRSIRPRSSEDVRLLQEVVPKSGYPFSDEFDTTPMDFRWLGTYDPAQYSLTSNPGWLTMTGPCDLWTKAPGNWDMEVKMRLWFATDGRAPKAQYIGIGMSDSSSESGRVWAARVTSDGWLTTSLYLAEQSLGRVPVDPSRSIWFKVKARLDQVWVSYSMDGVTYSTDYPFDRGGRSYLQFHAGPSDLAVPVANQRMLIDYVRFSGIDQ